MHMHALEREPAHVHANSVSARPLNAEQHANISAVIRDLGSITAKPNLSLGLPKVE